ncbi:MAG: glycosyltransferase [Bacteroidota bacterium]|nr:glycosyltransferase [Bacteroidota bacterium]
MTKKPKLLVITHVLPFPLSAGQNLRVHYSLLAAKEDFDITILTFAKSENVDDVRRKLQTYCNIAIVLKSAYNVNNKIDKVINKISAKIYSDLTGLKESNYYISKKEFTLNRIKSALKGEHFDLVLFEYWHAWHLASYFKEQGSRTICDTNNILWQTYKVQYDKNYPSFIKKYHFNNYKSIEEKVWSKFDAIIAINREEESYIIRNVNVNTKVFHIAMGIDISKWKYQDKKNAELAIAYYGGLGTKHNVESAKMIFSDVLPSLRADYPNLKYYIIGSNPPDSLIKLTESDKNAIVTGFVADLNETFHNTMIVLIPWVGTYGFRSRIIEVMASGTLVICSKDAISGMELEVDKGLKIASTPVEFINKTLQVLKEGEASIQGKFAREQVENKFTFENTYVKGFKEIQKWIVK